MRLGAHVGNTPFTGAMASLVLVAMSIARSLSLTRDIWNAYSRDTRLVRRLPYHHYAWPSKTARAS